MKDLLVMSWVYWLLTSCASLDAGGEFAGKITEMREEPIPKGMVFIPQGSFRMGPVSADSIWNIAAEQKQVSVESFWMDRTEVTNAEYRRFVYYVRDSIVRERLASPSYGGISLYRITENAHGDPIPPRLNWAVIIPWKHPDADERRALASLYHTDSETNTLRLDEAQLIFHYKNEAAQPDTVAVYPNETSWTTDFQQACNTPYQRTYFSHAGYNTYPVTGVSWKQATAFCAWRTRYHRQGEPFRLPTEAEWEYAARAGNSQNSYPWIGDSLRTVGGCYRANFKPSAGNYTADGHLITSRVKSYPPNAFGLFDMAGNVAEWTSSTYAPAALRRMNDLNPNFIPPPAPNRNAQPEQKAVRGGSWKDISLYIRSTTRAAAQPNEQHAYIGFRCVRTQLTYN